MVHLVLYGVVALAVAGGLFAVAARFLPAGEQIAPPVRDEPPWELPPDRVLRAEDIDAVRLPVALRGYRFAETDILLDRLAGELAARDREIARLRGEGVEDDPAVGDVPDEQVEEPQTEETAPAAEDEAPSTDFGLPSMHGTATHYTPPPAVHDDYAQPAAHGEATWAADAPPWGVAPEADRHPADSGAEQASGAPAVSRPARARQRRRRPRT